jgi:hypothetical protein
MSTSRHLGARSARAGLADGAINKVKFIEEVNNVHSEPLIQVFTLREANSGRHVATSESSERFVRIVLKLLVTNLNVSGLVSLHIEN